MQMKCSIAGCANNRLARGWCAKHYARWQAHGDPTRLLKRERGTVTINSFGHVVMGDRGIKKRVHVLIAEAALGHPLPAGARVHHVNECPADNSRHNLVICPSEKYHRLLHTRTDAWNACGNANLATLLVLSEIRRSGEHED